MTNNNESGQTALEHTLQGFLEEAKDNPRYAERYRSMTIAMGERHPEHSDLVENYLSRYDRLIEKKERRVG